MDVKFNKVTRKGVTLTEVSFNSKLVYIVMPHEDVTDFVVVDPYAAIPSKPFADFDDASAYAAAIVTGSYYD